MQDAQAAVRLYTMFRKDWEEQLAAKRARKGTTTKPGTGSTKQSSKTATTVSAGGYSGSKYQDSDSD